MGKSLDILPSYVKSAFISTWRVVDIVSYHAWNLLGLFFQRFYDTFLPQTFLFCIAFFFHSNPVDGWFALSFILPLFKNQLNQTLTRMPFEFEVWMLQRLPQSCTINQYACYWDLNLGPLRKKCSDTMSKNQFNQNLKLMVEGS